MKTFKSVWKCAILCALCCGVSTAAEETLRQYADKMGFFLGNIIQGNFWRKDPQYEPIIGKEFNTIFSFATFKQTEPQQGQFDFHGMDRDMQLAQKYNIKLIGVGLIYRKMSDPPWLDGHQSAQELDAILKNHLENVIHHGGSTYYAWEVVNEPLDAPNNPWGHAFGIEGYIAKAYQYAHEADPNAHLLLNEAFGKEGIDRKITDRFFDLVNKVKKLGGPIDIVGTETHLEAQKLHPDYLDEFRYFLDKARQSGVKVYVSEMDLYQGPPGALPDPAASQKKIFHDVLSTCLADSNCIGFNAWGVADKNTWLATRPGPERHPDAKPLLFDDNYQKKPAYDGVLDALREAASKGRGSSQP